MIYDILKQYGSGDEVLKLLSNKLCKYLPDEEHIKVAKELYEASQGKHFDECFAKEQERHMYYEDNGRKIYAPYWDDTTSIYNQYKRRISSAYNKWDFDVTMNMIKSDYYPLLKRWFPEEKDLDEKIIELTVNWLNDDDNPFGDSKIWCYFK